MITKDIFALIVRLAGVGFIIHALDHIPMAIFDSMNLSGPAFYVPIIWHLALGCWLLLGAPPLLRLAYPDKKVEVKSPTPTIQFTD